MRIPNASLISEDYEIALKNLMQTLPRVGLGCFEIRLSENDSRVDFQICPFLQTQEFDQTLNYLQKESLRAENRRHKAQWDHLHAFSATLSAAHSFAYGAINNIWLVYDILNPKKQTEPPWVYIGLLDRPLIPKLNTIIGIKAQEVFYDRVTEKLKTKLNFFQSNLPRTSYLCAIGFKTDQHVPTLRLAYKFDYFSEAMSFLRAIAWKGNIEALEYSFCQFFSGSIQTSLAFDFSTHVSSKIGLERSFLPEEDSASIMMTIQPILKTIHADPLKLDGIAAWHSLSRPQMQDSNQINWLNHIKLVFTEDGFAEAKGYLFYREANTTA